ncbi:MAG TPA: AI-2E family transporter, partial [Solirubrobacterales bacterium]|nr:AI-2E family transporter [Solirubrobacterales bacterium]
TPRVALLIAAAVVVGVVLWIGRQAVSPFVVGLLLVYLLDPPVEWLARRRVPRWLAVLIVYVVVVLVLVQAFSIMLRPLIEQIRTFVTDLPGLQRQMLEFYQSVDLPPAIRAAIDDWLAGFGEDGFDPGIFAPVIDLTAGFISGIFGYLIIPVWAFYLLKDRPQLMASFDRALPSNWRDDVWTVLGEVQRVFGQWVRGQLFLGVTVGVATFIGLEVLNVAVDPIFGRFALLLAVTAGILELLPIIGPIIAAVPAVLLAATAGPQAALAALLLYLLVQQVENNVLVPKIQGDAVELHPSAVMFSLVLGGAIAGLLGAILALPITAAARNVYRYLFRRLSEGEVEPADASSPPEGPGAADVDRPTTRREPAGA